jgi:hypothetical protein
MILARGRPAKSQFQLTPTGGTPAIGVLPRAAFAFTWRWRHYYGGRAGDPRKSQYEGDFSVEQLTEIMAASGESEVP